MKKLNQVVNEATNNDLKIDIDINELSQLLLEALAEEYNAWYAYTIVIPFLFGQERKEVCELYKETAEDELNDHAAWLLERLSQLNITPDRILSPDDWNVIAPHKYIKPDSSFNVVKSLQQNIQAEKDAIETYTKIEKILRDKDIVSHAKIKEILADEQEHLTDLEDLLNDITK
jgi:bacterioferritin